MPLPDEYLQMGTTLADDVTAFGEPLKQLSWRELLAVAGHASVELTLTREALRAHEVGLLPKLQCGGETRVH